MTTKKKYTRILSIDGGGIRGIIPGTILIYIEKQLQALSGNPDARIADYFDLIAGTSTGGILSCCYLLKDEASTKPKYTASEIVDLYLEHGEKIFKTSLAHKIRSAGGILDEKYPKKGMQGVLKHYMGDAMLSELLKPTLITAYDIEKRKTHFFTQHDASKQGQNFLVREVAESTASAPTYFECARIKDDLNRDYTLVDGGLFANNPTLCAYAEARNSFKRQDGYSSITAADMLILSLGTGSNKKVYPYKKAKNWGLAEWVKPVIDIMMCGVSETVDYQVRQIYDAIECPNQYVRIEAALPNSVEADMDDASPENMRALKKHGEALTKNYRKEIDEFLKKLISSAPEKLLA